MGFRFVSLGSKVAYTSERVKGGCYLQWCERHCLLKQIPQIVQTLHNSLLESLNDTDATQKKFA